MKQIEHEHERFSYKFINQGVGGQIGRKQKRTNYNYANLQFRSGTSAIGCQMRGSPVQYCQSFNLGGNLNMFEQRKKGVPMVKGNYINRNSDISFNKLFKGDF